MQSLYILSKLKQIIFLLPFYDLKIVRKLNSDFCSYFPLLIDATNVSDRAFPE